VTNDGEYLNPLALELPSVLRTLCVYKNKYLVFGGKLTRSDETAPRSIILLKTQILCRQIKVIVEMRKENIGRS